MPWTPEQVLALAPDAPSAKSGKDLSASRKWKTLGADEACAWGTIQGSGKNPYQACIDFSGPAFKCTCPSRKFPCKHGLGLFLIVAQQAAALTEKKPPAWTTEWLVKRVEKEEKKTAKAAEPATPLDPEAERKAAAAAEKRAASREVRVSAGLEELGVWLNDLIRNGFTGLPGKPAGFWETPAARLVDAQAPGLARRVRALDGITTTGERWPAQLLREASLLHLAREGWSRIGSLLPAVQADVRAVLGFTANQEEVLAETGIRDQWLIIGQRIEEEERLRVQRTWLFGSASKRFALSLSFSAGPNQPLDMSLIPWTIVDAELVFFPGAWPLRAIVKQRHGVIENAPIHLPHQTITLANALAAGAFAASPWLERVPFALSAVTPIQRPYGWIVRDEAGHGLPLDIVEAKAWTLVALAGGRPVGIAGEWDGERLRPLSIWSEGRFLRV
ncbi:MAG: zinc finger, domain protein [Pedosphaera sp.]|nr:zinc finger, domain protein [Pedosphaera sp.]